MNTRNVTTLDGSTFLIANTAGDLIYSANTPSGFFYKDMRHLSQWQLLIDRPLPQLLSCDDVEYYCTQHFLAPETGSIYENPHLSVARRRMLGDGFVEAITVANHSSREIKVRVDIYFGADFCDLFEVKDALKKKG